MLKTIPGNFTLNFDGFKSFCENIEFENNQDKINISINLDKKNFNLQEFKDNIAKSYLDFRKTFTPEVSFEELVKKINKDYPGNLAGSNIILSLISGRNIYVTHSGDAECYLIRNNKLNVILESSIGKSTEEDEKENLDLFTNMASGYLSDNDILLFSSKRILRRFTSLQLIEGFQDGISEGLEMMKPIFENEEYSISVSAIHIKMSSPFQPKGRNIALNKTKILSYVSVLQNKIDDLILFISKKTKYPYEIIQRGFVAIIGVLILFGLISMIAFSSKNSQKNAMYDQYKIEILKVDKQLEVAESRSMMGSISDANAILGKVEEKVSEILDSGMFREESVAILSKIETMRDGINKIKRYKNLETIKLVDLSDSIGEGEAIIGLVNFQGFSFAYTQSKIYKISLNKIEEVFDFVEGNLIKDVTVMTDKGILLVFTQSHSLFEFNGKTFEKMAVDGENNFKEFVDISSYSRFVYLLQAGTSTDSGTGAEISKGQVWKYQRNQGSYSPGKVYLDGEDFSEALSIAIDGSVYILNKGGYISQFYSGKPVNFSYKGDTELIKESEEIYTKLDYLNIYLLDKTNNKIIVLRKTNAGAEFVKQYIFESDSISGFFVDRNEQEITVSGKNKIYKISLIN